MLGATKFYLLFQLHYILIKCLMPGHPAELSVRKCKYLLECPNGYIKKLTLEEKVGNAYIHTVMAKYKKATNMNIRVDKKLIERKRQDTMDMCRIFTEETEKLEKLTELNERKKVKTKEKNRHRRSKREIALNSINPVLNLEDAQRVENIVDKMYEDMLEEGQKVEYRRGNISALVYNKTESTTKPSRRFNFAPAFMGIMESPTSESPESNGHTIPSPYGSKTPRFKYGVIPYFIDSKTYDIHLAEIIMKAFDYFEKATCIRLQRLRERPTDRESLRKVEWLYITNPTGIKQCVHSNDRAEIKGVQMIVFGYDCMSLGDITHEIMHVLGFPHEHVRPDRDQYITIMWNNIKPGYRKFFELLDTPVLDNLPYDYASVLHYPPRAFSRNGQVTIMTQPGVKVGQREGLSEIDIEKISMVYSSECVKRNKEYLLKTCPSVVRADTKSANTTKGEIQEYYQARIWPYAIVNYQLKDKAEFSHEELENINAVINHIEKETCIEFRDLTSSAADIDEESSDEDTQTNSENEIVSNKDTEYDSTQQEASDATGTQEDNEAILPESKEESSGSDDAGLRKGKTKNNVLPSDSNRLTKGVSLKNTKILVRKMKSLHSKDKLKKKPITRVKDSNKTFHHRSPSRRHASNILTFTRSAKPGCTCPKPMKPVYGQIVKVEINADCFNSVNDLLHLFVHILGLEHQHNSHDRDSYLHIVWDQLSDNVRADMMKKLPPAASVGFPYDYQSVMHYPWLQIKNGRTNIMYPIWNDGWAMGHWQGLSSIDVQKLNLLYYKQCVLRKQEAEKVDSKRVTVSK